MSTHHKQAASILWFRRDFRLADNPALRAALQQGGPVIPVFIWAPDEEEPWPPGAASRWWLHHSLVALAEALDKKGSRLIVRSGSSERVLRLLIRETGATAVFWNRLYEPAVLHRDRRIKSTLRDTGIRVETFNSALLFEPWTIANKSGRPFQVFTPFWRYCGSRKEPSEPVPAPREIPFPKARLRTVSLDSLGLLPKIGWDDGLYKAWTPGERGAKQRLRTFVKKGLADYEPARDQPGLSGTSRLSPHLHFGEIGPAQIWHAVQAAAAEGRQKGRIRSAETFLRELGWREFAYHLLFHFPHTSDRPLREEFNDFPWRSDPAGIKAWQEGRTGYPIVDAGLRELWRTGWMHNRVRMIAASFLVKDLLISWTAGARWFWDTLVDADLADNTLGWQWTAGCGADAAPYFRIFNPVLQGGKFDPEGTYVRRWVPELERMPDRWIHKPWEAPEDVLRKAGVELGTTYPHPMVDHAKARKRALEAVGMEG